MGKLRLSSLLGILVLLGVVISSTFGLQDVRNRNPNYYGGGRESSSSALSCRGACPCPSNKYRPFCATDGRQEITFENKCRFECAQRCNTKLRIRFEGVCAKKYVHRVGKNWK